MCPITYSGVLSHERYVLISCFAVFHAKQQKTRAAEPCQLNNGLGFTFQEDAFPPTLHKSWQVCMAP